MKRQKYIFRWKLGSIEVEPTWAYSPEDAWERAMEICRPHNMKRASRKRVREYLELHGEVVELDD